MGWSVDIPIFTSRSSVIKMLLGLRSLDGHEQKKEMIKKYFGGTEVTGESEARQR